MKADAMLEKGDRDGVATWRRVVRAVEELLRERPPAAAEVHYRTACFWATTRAGNRARLA